MTAPVRIGSRASKLARTQTRQMQLRICQALGAPEAEADRVAPVVLITTTGDRIQDRRLLELGGKQLFTKEIEEALLAGQVDCAVHSYKDVPAEAVPGLTIAATPRREDPRDALLSPLHGSFDALPEGARLGTASLRRGAQAMWRRGDLRVELMRGNVDTRLAKLERGEADAAVLAAAGLKRLGLDHLVREYFDPVAQPPAPAQGALAIQTREADVGAAWVQALRCPETTVAVAAERGALVALEGSCRTAIGAHARLDGPEGAQVLRLVVEALAPDGSARWRREHAHDMAGEPDPESTAAALGLRLGLEIREEAGDRITLGR
ncbi:MAG: hydroxymethylbilane synthase [Proteobacteria bacterium]|nr:hydroxymethylbilane synthase [Pseudomonadota bacterium]